MSKASVTQIIIDNVYDNTDNEITGGMVQTALTAIVNDEYTQLATYQPKLVSGTNIKTVGGTSLLGTGNIALSAGTVGAYSKTEIDSLLNVKVNKTTTVNGKALSGNITLAAADVSALPTTTLYAASPTVGGAATSANKVNSTLTIQQNGTSAGTFNGSAATTINITPSGIGAYTTAQVDTALAAKQATLVSGTNIKTVNNTTLLGSGNIAVQPTLVSGTNIKTINGVTLLGTGDISVGAGINVVDNLTSTSASNALSANQGNVLNTKSTATNNRRSLTIADFSNLPTGVTLNAGFINEIKMNNMIVVNFTFDLSNGTNPLNITSSFTLDNLMYAANEDYYSTGVALYSVSNIDEGFHCVIYDGLNHITIENWGIDPTATRLYFRGSITYLTDL